MTEQPGEPERFGLHPDTHTTDLLGGQYRPEHNGYVSLFLGFQGYFYSLLRQMFLEMLQAIREARQEKKHESN